MATHSPHKTDPQAANAARWTHPVAWTLCVVTFLLLWVGGLVTTTKSGMAVPDWPGTYGHNLWLYPWQTWIFGPWDLFIEHGHRLCGTLAGLLTIALLVLLWRHDERRWMQYVGIGALVGVIGQGVLGGMRVLLGDRLLAMLHGSIGPLFFGLTVAMVVWTSQTWHAATRDDSTTSLQSRLPLASVLPLASIASLLVYFQLVLGALLRHLPVTASPATFSTVVKAHLFLAAFVTLAALAMTWRTSVRGMPNAVRLAGRATGGVVAVQVVLGLTTWLAKYGVPDWAEQLVQTPATAIIADGWWQTHVVTAHQATGALLFAGVLTTLLLAARWAPDRASIVRSNRANVTSGTRATT